jgi:hypothetical protein
MELVQMAATELSRVGEGSDTAVATVELAGVRPNVRVTMGVVAAGGSRAAETGRDEVEVGASNTGVQEDAVLKVVSVPTY